MQDLGKVTIKTKLGGGMNVLCYALAGFIAAKAINELDKVVNRAKRDEELKEAFKAVKDINDLVDRMESMHDEKDLEES